MDKWYIWDIETDDKTVYRVEAKNTTELCEIGRHEIAPSCAFCRCGDSWIDRHISQYTIIDLNVSPITRKRIEIEIAEGR